jgi:hypothetical protein
MTEVKAMQDIQAAHLGGGHNFDDAAIKHYRQRREWLS